MPALSSGWNMRSPLPVLMFLRGHRGEGAEILSDAPAAPVASAFRRLLRTSGGFAGRAGHARP